MRGGGGSIGTSVRVPMSQEGASEPMKGQNNK